MNKNELNANDYIEKYIQLENIVKTTFHLRDSDSISYFLRNENNFKKYREDIKYCQDVRNWLHHNKKVNGEFAITPNKAMIDFIDSLINKIVNRPKCSDICIKKENICYQNIDGNIREMMKKMYDNCYTHIPILENEIVIGVFDENSVFNYLSDEEIVSIDYNLRFSNIKKYLSLTDRDMEKFVFVKYHSYVDELEEIFEEYFKNGDRVGMVFLTADGKETSPLMGIITPWDIIQSR